MDSPGFHSLSRLCRKSHVDRIHDPPTDAEYLWQGGNKFNELLRALLEYLISNDFVLSQLNLLLILECFRRKDDKAQNRSFRFRNETINASSKTIFYRT